MYIHKYTILLIYEKNLTYQSDVSVNFFQILFGYVKIYSYLCIKLCKCHFSLLEKCYTYVKKAGNGKVMFN